MFLPRPRLAGSSWTALERTFGWTHFTARERRREGKQTFILMVATCDSGVQFWVREPFARVYSQTDRPSSSWSPGATWGSSSG
jgi:tryptophan-rich hypothetical protein